MKIKHILLTFIILLILEMSIILYLADVYNTRPNIIFITVDALRPDHLGCYGYERNTSPNIDKLAEKGVIFSNCFSVGPTTVTSSPALFTGNYLALCDIKSAKETCYDDILGDKFTTFAEYLNKSGYFTIGYASSNAHYKKGTGYEQGFDEYYSRISDEQQGTQLLNFLENYDSSTPFFIWYHNMDVHAPYKFPDSIFQEFVGDKLWKKNSKELKVMPEGTIEDKHDKKGYLPKNVYKEGKTSLNYYMACYDAEIRYMDFFIGKIMKKVDKNTLIIITSDHGECLGEHNKYFSHGGYLWKELLHISLIIEGEKYFTGGKKISNVVSSVDIVPTVLKKVDPIWYFFNKSRFAGENLRRILKGKKMKRKYIYSYHFSRGERDLSIRDIEKNYKYVLGLGEKKEVVMERFENKEKNKIPDNVKEKIKNALKIWRKKHPTCTNINVDKRKLDEETKKRLKSLGYIE